MNLFDEEDDPALVGEFEDARLAKPRAELDALARAIRRLEPDILALQEVESLAAAEWFRDAWLGGMGYDHVASIDAGDLRGIECSLLSRLPILDAKARMDVDLGATHPEKFGSRPSRFAGQPVRFARAPLVVDILLSDDADARVLTIFIVHLVAGGAENTWWRRLEGEGLARLAASLAADHPERLILIAGDFNARPGEGVIEPILDGGFADALAIMGRETSPTHRSGRRIDYIFTDASLTSLLVAAPAPDLEAWAGSDHLPVAIDFALSPR